MDDTATIDRGQTWEEFLSSYPPGRKFFANRLTKDFFESGAYAELSSLGADGRNAAALVILIASKEDRHGYKAPVRYWVSQLQELLYMHSPKQPGAAIKLAVKSGWLACWSKSNRHETHFYTINPTLEEDTQTKAECIPSEIGSNQVANASEIGSNDDSNASTIPSGIGSITQIIPSNIPSTIPSEIGSTPFLIPSLIPSLEKEPNSKPKSAGGYTTDFESFWNVFPSLRKSGKKQAFEAWKKALKEAAPNTCPGKGGWAEYLISKAADYAESPTGKGQFAKGPTPWLNQGCWEDPKEAWMDSGDRGSTRLKQLGYATANGVWDGSYRPTSTNDGGGF
ncbi:MAG: hypothetical protein K9M08_08465 [Pirellula sp.]|nr:hypothetical protein [Pirellula sp.]